MSSTRSSFDDKIAALKDSLGDRDPFYTGACAIPEFQRFLYYTDGDNFRRIKFSSAQPDELGELYRACKPAEFGRGGETILDESYRKAGKMDVTSFSTPFDPRNLGISEQVSKALLSETCSATMDMELYKLNVYGAGDFFKPHKDTPRSKDMFGSLVVVLPAPHEGGQFVLRKDGKEWTIDFADKLAATGTTEPSAFFVAFYSDVEHEVLPVTAGYRVTLTYNLYRKATGMNPTVSSVPTPYYQKLKQTLVNLVNDKSVLPKGGYLGFGLAHKYVYGGDAVTGPLLDQLKGTDRALAAVADALGLHCFVRLLYRDIYGSAIPGLNLLTTKAIVFDEKTRMLDKDEPYTAQYSLGRALKKRSIEQVEGVDFVGDKAKSETTAYSKNDDTHPTYWSWLRRFYRNPVTEVLEVTPMESSIELPLPCLTYGNEAEMEYYYGTACMLIAVGPAETRQLADM